MADRDDAPNRPEDSPTEAERYELFAGPAYLRILILTYGYHTMFSAYNDGPVNLEEKLRITVLL